MKRPERDRTVIVDVIGRMWRIQFDSESIDRVKCQLGWDLRKLAQGVIEFPLTLEAVVSIVWCTVAPEASRRGVTPEAFGRSLHSEQATSMMVDAFIFGLSQLLPAHLRQDALSVLRK